MYKQENSCMVQGYKVNFVGRLMKNIDAKLFILVDPKLKEL